MIGEKATLICHDNLGKKSLGMHAVVVIQEYKQGEVLLDKHYLI